MPGHAHEKTPVPRQKGPWGTGARVLSETLMRAVTALNNPHDAVPSAEGSSGSSDSGSKLQRGPGQSLWDRRALGGGA